MLSWRRRDSWLQQEDDENGKVECEVVEVIINHNCSSDGDGGGWLVGWKSGLETMMEGKRARERENQRDQRINQSSQQPNKHRRCVSMAVIAQR